MGIILYGIVLAGLLCGAIRAFVLLDALSFGRSNFDAFAVEPALTDVTADPELIGIIDATANATKCLAVLLILLFILSRS